MQFILTDEIDSGKSGCVLALATRLIEAGGKISGWVTVAHMEDGKKAGHDIVTIEGGRLSARIPFTRAAPFEGSFPWRRFHFSARAFEVAQKLATDVDLFIIDELGPLELYEEGGFIGIARRALAESKNTLCVVRRGLDVSAARLAGGETRSFPLARAGELEAALAAELGI